MYIIIMRCVIVICSHQ